MIRLNRAKLTDDLIERAKAENLVIFEILIDTRFLTSEQKEGSVFEHLKSHSSTGLIHLEDAEKLYNLIKCSTPDD